MISGVIDQIKSRPFSLLALIFAIGVMIVTAVNSVGYHHADEHYQIIEFANYFLGNIPADKLPWEFNAQIRPSIQPIIAATFIKVCNGLGYSDPFQIVQWLRISTGLFGLFVYLVFIHKWRRSIFWQGSKNLVNVLSAVFLWFMPYLLVRFSSENLASLLFVLGFSFVLQKPSIKTHFFVGLCFSLSIAFRFQMAVSVLGMFIWLLFIQRSQIQKLLFLLYGLCLGMIIMILFDFWFYGEFVFIPWNYLVSNLIEGKAASFGVQHWTWYIEEMIYSLTPVILFIATIGCIWLLVKQPKHPVFWIFIPFMSVHFMIGHKELRFLFPVIFCLPVLIVGFYEFLEKLKFGKSISLILAGFILAVNCVAAVVTSDVAAGSGRLGLAKFIHSSYKNQKVVLICTPYSNPYEPWPGLYTHWYNSASKKLEISEISNLNELENVELASDKVHLLLVRNFDFEYAGNNPQSLSYSTSLLKSTYSTGLEELGVYLKILDRSGTYHLYQLAKKKEG